MFLGAAAAATKRGQVFLSKQCVLMSFMEGKSSLFSCCRIGREGREKAKRCACACLSFHAIAGHVLGEGLKRRERVCGGRAG